MYILNTTFAVEETITNAWAKFVSRNLIPELQAHGFCNIKIYQIMHNGDNDELPTFALHCEHGHIEVISEWLNKEEPKQKKELQQLFNNKVLLFSTTMKEIAIK